MRRFWGLAVFTGYLNYHLGKAGLSDYRFLSVSIKRKEDDSKPSPSPVVKESISSRTEGRNLVRGDL